MAYSYSEGPYNSEYDQTAATSSSVDDSHRHNVQVSKPCRGKCVTYDFTSEKF